MGNVTNILVIDGQGGGLGKQLVSALKGLDNIRITAVGTNSAATAAMHKAGADRTATGENRCMPGCGYYPRSCRDRYGGCVPWGNHACNGGCDRQQPGGENIDTDEPLWYHNCRQ